MNEKRAAGVFDNRQVAVEQVGDILYMEAVLRPDQVDLIARRVVELMFEAQPPLGKPWGVYIPGEDKPRDSPGG